MTDKKRKINENCIPSPNTMTSLNSFRNHDIPDDDVVLVSDVLDKDGDNNRRVIIEHNVFVNELKKLNKNPVIMEIENNNDSLYESVIYMLSRLPEQYKIDYTVSELRKKAGAVMVFEKKIFTTIIKSWGWEITDDEFADLVYDVMYNDRPAHKDLELRALAILLATTNGIAIKLYTTFGDKNVKCIEYTDHLICPNEIYLVYAPYGTMFNPVEQMH